MRYRAFISYSHADTRWARWLIRRLESYKVPRRLVGTVGSRGVIGPRLGTLFRDREELTAAGDLGATIRAALADSEALVVVCSTNSARSRWVNAEVQAFRDSGRGDMVLCFVVDGDPGSDLEGTACFPPAMRITGPDGEPVEPLAADARPHADGREAAFLKLVAALLGVGYDVLAQREAQRRYRRLIGIATASLAGMTIALSLAATAYVARNDAQRRQAQAEDILGFMLGDLRGKLTDVGRLDLMRAVDDKATTYFATLDARDLSDETLEAQARSLTGIGQVRLDEGNHPEAMAAFTEAHARSSALHGREPGDGQRLFDLAQAEYWIGFVAMKQGRQADARAWLQRYRDSAIRLAAMDPGKPEWQQEVAYGHQNLAVMDEQQGRYAEAAAAYEAARLLYVGMLDRSPSDSGVRYELANITSWLGSSAVRSGDLAKARELFTEEARLFGINRSLEPKKARWNKDWIIARTHLAKVQSWSGQREAASSGIEATAVAAHELVDLDPANQRWRELLAHCLWWRSVLAQDDVAAETDARTAERLLATAHVATPQDDNVTLWLARARGHLAQRALARGDAGAAREWLSRSRQVLQPAWQARPSEALRVMHAGSDVLLGEIEHAAGNASAALAAWQRAEHLLLDAITGTLPFERLDPLVRSQLRLGRTDAAQAHLASLANAGYQPLLPWPDASAGTVATGR